MNSSSPIKKERVVMGVVVGKKMFQKGRFGAARARGDGDLARNGRGRLLGLADLASDAATDGVDWLSACVLRQHLAVQSVLFCVAAGVAGFLGECGLTWVSAPVAKSSAGRRIGRAGMSFGPAAETGRGGGSRIVAPSKFSMCLGLRGNLAKRFRWSPTTGIR